MSDERCALLCIVEDHSQGRRNPQRFVFCSAIEGGARTLDEAQLLHQLINESLIWLGHYNFAQQCYSPLPDWRS
jgi:hypothetical protein